jgi:hypothetical protein
MSPYTNNTYLLYFEHDFENPKPWFPLDRIGRGNANWMKVGKSAEFSTLDGF